MASGIYGFVDKPHNVTYHLNPARMLVPGTRENSKVLLWFPLYVTHSADDRATFFVYVSASVLCPLVSCCFSLHSLRIYS